MFKIKIPYAHAKVLAVALKTEFGVDFTVVDFSEYVALGENEKMHRDRKKHVVTFTKAFILGVQTADTKPPTAIKQD